MKNDKLKHVPLSNNEIDIVLKMLKSTVPSKDEEEAVFEIIQRLGIIRML